MVKATFSQQDIAMDIMIDMICGDSLTAKTHEGVEILYTHAKRRMQGFIASGIVRYKSDILGNINEFHFSFSVYSVKDELRKMINEDPLE